MPSSPAPATFLTPARPGRQGTRLARALAALLACTCTLLEAAPTALPAFPGAQGFGATASGGRGGRVVHVTTLAARGSGSLQAALDQRGPRTIVFDVSGVIQGVPILSQGDVTVAGQTSPAGITLRGLLIQGDEVNEEPQGALPRVAPRNFIVRHLRLRPAGFDSADGGGDGLRVHHAARGIIDHVSIGNATDEAVQISFARDLTLQSCLLAETLGPHAEFGGMLLNYSDPARGWPLTRISIHHCMWNRVVGRSPEISRENIPDPEVCDLEWSANVLWDVQRPVYLAAHNPQTGRPLHTRLNMEANLMVENPAHGRSHGLLAIEGGPDATRPSLTSRSQLWLHGNKHSLAPQLRDWELVYNCNDLLEAAATNGLPYSNLQPAAQASATRLPFPRIDLPASPQALLDLLSRQVGALPRDPMDRRLMQGPSQGRFASADPSVNPAKDTIALDFTARTAPRPLADRDQDGMPDAWERAHQLDPACADDRNGRSLSVQQLGVAGYTNLEVYLEERHRALLEGR